MDTYFRAAAAVLLTVILSLTLTGQAKSTAGVLVMVVGAMVLGVAFSFLKDVLSFLDQLCQLSALNEEMVEILCKCVGISVISEVSSMICSDSGNASLGKSLQLLSAAVILWLSLPLFQALVDLVRKILEAV